MLRNGLTIDPADLDASGSITHKKRGVASLLGIGQIVAWGTLYYSYPLLAEAMSGELSLSKTQIYGAATAGLLASACISYPIGKAVDRGHGRTVMVAGSVLAGTLLICWGGTSNLSLFYALMLLLGLAQSMTLYDAAFAVIAKSTAPDQISRSIIQLTLWGGFASTVFIPLTEFLIQMLGWRNALNVLGVLNFALAGVYFLGIPRKKPGWIQIYETGPVHPSLFNDHPVRAVLKSRPFWGLLVCFTLFSLAFSGLTFHLYPFFKIRNVTSSTLAAGLALLGPSQVLGRLLLWKLSKRQSVSRSGRWVLLGFPASVLAIIFLNPIWGLFTFVIVYGIANGIMTIVRGIAVSELISTENYGSIYSFLSIPSTICKALGPYALAYGYERAGSYDFSVQTIFWVTVLMLISYWYVAIPPASVSNGFQTRSTLTA